ncbi:MAG TPA: Fe-S cluster assembly protein IscX [Bacteroidota bacterium]|nr:Fe-S cluster assembly protein IscX [Bacteroidota bacterium]
MTLTWRDVEGLARELAQRFPGEDPLGIDLRRLHAMIMKLPSFKDEPDAVTDELLEKILAAWYEQSSP